MLKTEELNPSPKSRITNVSPDVPSPRLNCRYGEKASLVHPDCNHRRRGLVCLGGPDPGRTIRTDICHAAPGIFDAPDCWPLAQAGFLMAACIALYAEALLRGYVARVILLFYLTPVWSTLLARVFLGDRITGPRLVAIACGLAGMFIVFGSGSGVPVPRTAAEWMGLLSGIIFIHLPSPPRGNGRELMNR